MMSWCGAGDWTGCRLVLSWTRCPLDLQGRLSAPPVSVLSLPAPPAPVPHQQVRTLFLVLLVMADDVLSLVASQIFSVPSDAHCCHMGTAIKHPMSGRIKPPALVIFDIRAL